MNAHFSLSLGLESGRFIPVDQSRFQRAERLRPGTQTGFDRLILRQISLFSIIAHVLGDFHRTELWSAHGAEICGLVRFLGHVLVVILSRTGTLISGRLPCNLTRREAGGRRSKSASRCRTNSVDVRDMRGPCIECCARDLSRLRHRYPAPEAGPADVTFSTGLITPLPVQCRFEIALAKSSLKYCFFKL